MIHKVGTGGAAGSIQQAINYVLGEKDHSNEVRAGVTLLEGDPAMLADIEQTMTTKNTYVHTSLSFTKKETEMINANPEILDDILSSYKTQLAAGLPGADPSRLASLTVRHDESDGKMHVHMLTLRQDMETGKSYQPFVKQRGDIARFQDWNIGMQKEHGLENPNSAEHQRSAGWSKNLPEKVKDIRNEIDRVINEEIASGNISNRKDIINFINRTAGLKVARVIPSAISIKVDGHKQNIKLSGSVYNEHFRSTKELTGIIEARASVDYERAEQRLSDAMQKLADRSYKYTQENNIDMGIDTNSNQHIDSVRGIGLDVVSVSRNDEDIQNHGRRLNMGQSTEGGKGQLRADVGTIEREEIRTPEHKIFNGVEYDKDKQAWTWQGSYGYVHVQATDDGYAVTHGSKMEWQMAAQLLKENGASHVSLTCSTEQSMYRAIKAHADAGLKISSITLDGQQLPIEQIKDMVKQHDDTIKVNSNKYVNSRAEQERQTGEDIGAISNRSAAIDTTLTEYADDIERASTDVEQLIDTIETELERQRYEYEQANSCEITLS